MAAEATHSGYAKLRAHYIITPESLEVAVKKLSDALGSDATLLVKTAALKTKHIGDLFLLLSESLEGEKRKSFLSLVSDMDFD